MDHNGLTVIHMDCIDALRDLIYKGVQVDSIVTDPPYEFGFMGKAWDKSGIAFNIELWKLCLQILKPGGHLLSFGGSRTYHRMACAVEDAGFEIRDQIMWITGQGFPKSLDIRKAIDKMAGTEREIVSDNLNHRKISGVNYKGVYAGVNTGNKHIIAPETEAAKKWHGFGTALKPAHEPIVLARKPISEKTIAQNVLKHGTGAINIDGCRVEGQPRTTHKDGSYFTGKMGVCYGDRKPIKLEESNGRFPANIIHDGSTECRFFYCAKASKKDRNGSNHPTVKPLALMRYLCRLITPPGGTVLDPFAGSGTTGQAASEEGFKFILVEKDIQYISDIHKRLEIA